MAVDKKKKKSSKIKGYSKLATFLYTNVWKICLAIAICDFVHALFFVVNATISLVKRFNLYSVLGTIFWMLIVVLLLVGLLKRVAINCNCILIRDDLCLFGSGLSSGFIVDIGFLIWGIVSSVKVDWDHLSEFTIIFVGAFVEIACIYLVHRYYLSMDLCRYVYEPERGGQKKKKKRLDEKLCKQSQKKVTKKSSKKADKKKQSKK